MTRDEIGAQLRAARNAAALADLTIADMYHKLRRLHVTIKELQGALHILGREMPEAFTDRTGARGELD